MKLVYRFFRSMARVNLIFFIAASAYAGGTVRLECKLIEMKEDELVVRNKNNQLVHIKRAAIADKDLNLLKTSGKEKFVQIEVPTTSVIPANEKTTSPAGL